MAGAGVPRCQGLMLGLAILTRPAFLYLGPGSNCAGTVLHSLAAAACVAVLTGLDVDFNALARP